MVRDIEEDKVFVDFVLIFLCGYICFYVCLVYILEEELLLGLEK